MKIKSVIAVLTVVMAAGILCGCSTQIDNPTNESESDMSASKSESNTLNEETSVVTINESDSPETGIKNEEVSEKESESVNEEQLTSEDSQGPATLTYGYVEDVMGEGTVVKEVEICEGDYDTQIAFKTDKQIDDFSIYTVVMTGADEDGKPLFEETLFENLGTLKPDEYFLIILQFYGDTPEYAIEYTDSDKTVKHLYLTQSGFDGSIALTEY